MELKTVQGVILKAIAFRDFDQILTVYTDELGIVKFFCQRSLNSKNGRGAKTAPLSEVEIVYRERSTEIWQAKEISVLDYRLGLRQNLTILQSACDMVEAIESSQPISQPNHKLYALFTTFLSALSKAPHPFTLAAALRLKILFIDGWLNPDLLQDEDAAFQRALISEKNLANLLSIPIDKAFLIRTRKLMLSHLLVQDIE